MVEVFIGENNEEWARGEFDSLTQRVPPYMLERAWKFRRWQDRQAYLLGKVLLTKALRKNDYHHHSLHDIQYTAYSKPFLPDIEFNISHSGRFVICAVSRTNKIGIDIEEVKPMQVDEFTAQFTDQEMNAINSAQDRDREFFKYWTIKEAVIKADGKGLSLPLKEIEINKHVHVQGKIWHYYELGIDQDYVCHLACDAVLEEQIELHHVAIQV